MSKPKIYAQCPAGCNWETVHKDDFIKAATYFKLRIDENNRCYLEPWKQYKIIYENAFSITLKYSVGGAETEYQFTIQNNDKYANYVVFKLLEISTSTAADNLTIVYEVAGVRYTETISGTELALLGENYLYVDNANEVYLYNSDASYSVNLDDHYTKEETNEQIQNAINSAITTTLGGDY